MQKVGAKKHYIWQAGNRKEKLSNLIKQKGSEKNPKYQQEKIQRQQIYPILFFEPRAYI